jgi:glycyl-tRNA synthetase beta chain
MTAHGVGAAGAARADLLFEIGCEEIPAGMILKASRDLHVILAKQLASHALVDEPTAEASIETFGAPRRLVAIAKNIRVNQQAVTREVMGPPKSVAYGGTGEPTRAAQSFAEKQGVPLSKLTVVSTPKGEYVAARVTMAGKPAARILGEILPEAIREISWPRSMVWSGAHSPRFIRPIRWIVATLGGKTVACTYADVRSGHRTEGHRFLGKRGIAVAGAKDYEARLKANFVLCRPQARREKIQAELKSVPARKGLRAHEDPALLEMVTYLNEYPTVILGDFDPAFLVLPKRF